MCIKSEIQLAHLHASVGAVISQCHLTKWASLTGSFYIWLISDSKHPQCNSDAKAPHIICDRVNGSRIRCNSSRLETPKSAATAAASTAAAAAEFYCIQGSVLPACWHLPGLRHGARLHCCCICKEDGSTVIEGTTRGSHDRCGLHPQHYKEVGMQQIKRHTMCVSVEVCIRLKKNIIRRCVCGR